MAGLPFWDVTSRCHDDQKKKHQVSLLLGMTVSFQDVLERAPIFSSGPSANFPLPEQIVLK
jgi:hypothetical protein